MRVTVAFTPRRSCDVCGREEGLTASVVHHWNLRLEAQEGNRRTSVSRGVDLCEEHAKDKGQMNHHQFLLDMQEVGQKKIRSTPAAIIDED